MNEHASRQQLLDEIRELQAQLDRADQLVEAQRNEIEQQRATIADLDGLLHGAG
jgi:uncharacterized protein YlxW (UPF0749 family)